MKYLFINDFNKVARSVNQFFFTYFLLRCFPTFRFLLRNRFQSCWFFAHLKAKVLFLFLWSVDNSLTISWNYTKKDWLILPISFPAPYWGPNSPLSLAWRGESWLRTTQVQLIFLAFGLVGKKQRRNFITSTKVRMTNWYLSFKI